MTKESTREKYKRDTGLDPLTKTGAKTKAYSDWLLSEKCTVPWMSNWGKLYDKNKEIPYKTRDTLMYDLEAINKSNKLEEKCVIGNDGREAKPKSIESFRKESKAKFDSRIIKF